MFLDITPIQDIARAPTKTPEPRTFQIPTPLHYLGPCRSSHVSVTDSATVVCPNLEGGVCGCGVQVRSQMIGIKDKKVHQPVCYSEVPRLESHGFVDFEVEAPHLVKSGASEKPTGCRPLRPASMHALGCAPNPQTTWTASVCKRRIFPCVPVLEKEAQFPMHIGALRIYFGAWWQAEDTNPVVKFANQAVELWSLGLPVTCTCSQESPSFNKETTVNCYEERPMGNVV